MAEPRILVISVNENFDPNRSGGCSDVEMLGPFGQEIRMADERTNGDPMAGLDSTGGARTGMASQLLRNWQGSNKAALNELMPLIYAELHKLAASYLHRERAGHTFHPTDLVWEAYLRLVVGGPPASNDRVQFFAIAARTMRQILVDSARRRCASKRGSGRRPVTFDEAVAADRPEQLVELDDALIEGSKLDERKGRAIELYFYGSLTQDEIALALDIHVNTVSRDLRLGQAWIQTYLAVEGV